MSERHNIVNGKKYRFPSREISQAINLPCSGHIEKWPVYATGRHNATTTTKVVKNRRVKIVTLNDFEACLQPKPKFLVFLESHIRKEMQFRGAMPTGVSMIRLQIYRETFDYLIEAFTSYRPILGAIKREYEFMLKHYADEITKLEPLKDKLYFFAADCDRQIVELRVSEKEDYCKLLKVNEQLHRDAELLKVEIEDLKYQIAVLSETISTLYEQNREERDARNVLVLSKRDEDRCAPEGQNEAELNKVRLENEKLRIAVGEARRAHSEVQQALMQFDADYSDVVPRREIIALQKRYDDLTVHTETINLDHLRIEQEKKDLDNLYALAVEQRDAYYMKLMQVKVGQVPDWMVCAEFLASSLQNFAKLKRGKSYFEFVESIVDEILLSGIDFAASFEGSDEEAHETKKEMQLDELKSTLGEDAIRGAGLLAEMIATVLSGSGTGQERRKSMLIGGGSMIGSGSKYSK